MYSGIWTGMLVELPLDRALARLTSHGWRAFEVSTEHLDMIMAAADPEAEIEKALALAKELKLSIPQAHAHLCADVTHPDAARREKDIALSIKHFEISAKLGARNIVIHPGSGGGFQTKGDHHRILRENIEAFKRLVDVAGPLGLRIGVENLFDWPSQAGKRRFGSVTEDLLELADAVHSKSLGVTIDTSHANVQGLNLPRMIRDFGALLICTHISDNDGSGDQHKTPGGGKIDWMETMAAFRDIGYNGIFNLEIPGERHPVPHLLDLKSAHAERVATWLAEDLDTKE